MNEVSKTPLSVYIKQNLEEKHYKRVVQWLRNMFQKFHQKKFWDLGGSLKNFHLLLDVSG
jgi:hypothetical protein